jgi:hypothetical protein
MVRQKTKGILHLSLARKGMGHGKAIVAIISRATSLGYDIISECI